MAERSGQIIDRCDLCGKECEIEGPEYPLYVRDECAEQQDRAWEEDEKK